MKLCLAHSRPVWHNNEESHTASINTKNRDFINLINDYIKLIVKQHHCQRYTSQLGWHINPDKSYAN